jgi:hypothetical protein
MSAALIISRARAAVLQVPALSNLEKRGGG